MSFPAVTAIYQVPTAVGVNVVCALSLNGMPPSSTGPDISNVTPRLSSDTLKYVRSWPSERAAMFVF